MNAESLAKFFMPKDQSNGEDLFNNNAVTIANASDTQAQAYIKAPGSPRVSLSAEDIESSSFQANCSCSAARKGKLCKHIWATLLQLEADEADFLACRSEVEVAAAKPESDAVLAAKARQADYNQKRKEQNKARNKKIRDDKKKSTAATEPDYPYEVQAAIIYFSANGFELTHPLQAEALDTARRTLARVFHPDKGGTHEEILALNKNHDVIADYLES